MPRMIKILSPPPIHLDEGKATNTEPAIDRTHYIIKSRPIIELAISFPHRNNRESGFAILLCQRPSIQGTAPRLHRNAGGIIITPSSASRRQRSARQR